MIALLKCVTATGSRGATAFTETLCFITSDAQLLHFPASAVRPQGRTAGGMAGVRLAKDAKVVFFGAVDTNREAQVVTVAGSSSALPGTEVGAVKVTRVVDILMDIDPKILLPDATPENLAPMATWLKPHFINNDAEPHAGSQMLSPSLGSTSSAMSFETSGGV